MSELYFRCLCSDFQCTDNLVYFISMSQINTHIAHISLEAQSQLITHIKAHKCTDNRSSSHLQYHSSYHVNINHHNKSSMARIAHKPSVNIHSDMFYSPWLNCILIRGSCSTHATYHSSWSIIINQMHNDMLI